MMTTEKAPILRFSDHARGIEHVAARLENMADAFEYTGNEKVAGDLQNAAGHLYALAKVIVDTASEHINGELRNAQEGSASILKAILAGAYATKGREPSDTEMETTS